MSEVGNGRTNGHRPTSLPRLEPTHRAIELVGNAAALRDSLQHAGALAVNFSRALDSLRLVGTLAENLAGALARGRR